MISTKGRYAIRVLVDIAEQDKGGYVPLRDVAARQGMSENYLQRIARLLVDADILVGVSGKGGGYRLARPASECTVLEVLEAAEGTLACVACLVPGAEVCERAHRCETVGMWKRFDETVRAFFGGITVADLVAESRGRDDDE